MSTYAQVRDAVKDLPHEAQVAFAAVCARRALAEVPRVTADDPHRFPGLTEGLDLVWARLAQRQLAPDDAVRDANARVRTHAHVGDDPPAHGWAVAHAVNAVALALGAIVSPHAAADRAAVASAELVSLLTQFYEDFERVKTDEYAWQMEAIARLKTRPDRPFTPAFFAAIPECPRGKLVDEPWE